MTRNEAREYIREHPETYLERARRRGYVCPLCGNGKGRDGDGLETKDKIHFTCFRCHEIENNDIIDIIGKVEHIKDDTDKFKRAYEIYGIDIEPDRILKPTRQQAEKPRQEAKQMQEKKRYIFNDAIEQAHKALLDNPEAIKHFTDRGIDIDTIKRFKLGYAEQGHNSLLEAYPKNKASDKSKHALYNYVLPYEDADGNFTYFQTEISDRTQIDEYNDKYRCINNPTGDLPQHIFNERYITETGAGVIFICEGIYDALSVESAGYKAIGGMGTGRNRFIEICKRTHTDATFIIASDNDEAGQDAQERLKAELDELGIKYIIAPAATGKDYNDALRADRQAFITFIGEKVKEAEQAAQEKEAEQAAQGIEAAEIEAYEQDNAANRLHILDEYIAAQDLYKAIPTGFKDLDKIIGGGIRAGLYVIGAISSLGKTTFCLQVADNMAKQGQDILFYSLEMSEREIMAKSLSRESLEVSLDRTGNSETAKTTLQILTGKRDARTGTPYTEDDIATLQRARAIYTEYAGHIRIIEGIGDIDVKRIETDAEKHKAITGKTPIIVIDYLQILARYDAENDRRNYTDKQVIDKNILELKRLSRQFPIITISSFNRDSYTEPVNLSSFKESGSVEYTSDLLIALQYAGMDYEPDEKDTAHRNRVKDLLRTQEANGRTGKAQEIQLKVLKHRNGYRGDIALQFYPMFNTFRGIGEATGADNPFIQNEAKNGLDNKQRKVLEPI